jgi:hypothetical protein
MMHAELQGIVCSGARQGRQFTYALLEERVPRARTLTRDEALGELARRYFASHGPATLRDYAWWSGLTAGDARRGVEVAGSALERHVLDDQTYWRGPGMSKRTPVPASGNAHLLPNYDEYFVAYKDRRLVAGSSSRSGPRASDVFAHALIVDGRLGGTWTKTPDRGSVRVNVVSYRRLAQGDRRALSAAAERYGRFLKQAVTCAQGSLR